MFINISASGEYRDVVSGLNNNMALKFSPLGVERIYVDIKSINYLSLSIGYYYTIGKYR